MFINSLELENIRSYKKLTVNFSKHINLIIGANNSGKSTIIKALYKLQDLNSLKIEDKRKGEYVSKILLGLHDVSFADYRSVTRKNFRDPDNSQNLFVYYEANDQLHTNKYYFSHHNVNLSLDQSQASWNGDNSDFHAMPNMEDQNNFIYPFFAKRKISHYSNQGGRENTFSVLDDFRNLTSKIQKISNPSHHRNPEFQKYCIDILGFNIGVIPGTNNNENRIGIYVKGEFLIPLESMGEGISNIIGLITILLTENNKLFLIEELENDIHPQALKKLLNLIIEKSQNNQFVISSHSNIVLKHLGSLTDTKIFYTNWQPFDDESNSKIPTSILQEIRNTPQERLGILEKLGYDMFDYEFYKGYLILEESTSERLIREFFIPVFVPDLKNKIRTIAAQGASDVLPKFNDLHRLFLFLHKSEVYLNRAWVIADGDTAGKEAIEELRTKFKSWDASFFLNFIMSNFEEYYPNKFKSEIDSIMTMSNGHKKQEFKLKLLKSVLNWISENPEDAKFEFEKSANEVIEILKSIEKKIN